MRGAVGGDRQIGQLVFPSSYPAASPLEERDASAEGGTIICKMSYHWKKLPWDKCLKIRLMGAKYAHIWIGKVYCVIAYRIHDEAVLCIDKA